MTLEHMAVDALWKTAESRHASGGDHNEAVRLLRALIGKWGEERCRQVGLSTERLNGLDHQYLELCRLGNVDRDQRSRDADRLRVAREILSR